MPLPRSTPSDPALPLVRFLTLGALVCVAVLTLIDRGATRAYSTPWNVLFWFAQIAPLAALALRALARECPLTLPARPWRLLAAASAAVVLVSSLVSPYRGPSLLAALTPLSALAVFLLVFDWLTHDRDRRSDQLLVAAGLLFTAIAATSLVQWLALFLGPSDGFRHLASLIGHRNAQPLGHSNYTAGLALLMLPALVALAWRARAFARAGWSFAALLALAMLFTSGSRGGLLGLAALVLAALVHARLNWKKFALWTLAATAVALALTFTNPRTRAMLLTRTPPAAAPNPSNVQRTAMLEAGAAMGRDRPLPGWGVGTTPLVFPRYRAALDGGAENVLQLHSTPVQFWADFGTLGLACGLGWLVLVVRRSIRDLVTPTNPVAIVASVTLAGYGVFSLTDYQLDVPIFALGAAVCTALLAPPGANLAPERDRRICGLGAALVLAVVALFGRADPTPRLNVRALELATDPAQADAAIALLRESLALNPAQEIAQFNLGWLLVVRDPPAAERCFLAAAHLVPDKGGVYFGLGLARLNQNHRAAAARAFALECVDDPLFLTSPWWRVPAIAALRSAVSATALEFIAKARAAHAFTGVFAEREAAYLEAFIPWLDGHGAPGEILARARTASRVGYFAARPAVPDFAAAPIRAYHRARTGYPVLVRNLDLPTPVDLFEEQESSLAAGPLAFLFPPKGWLPSPLLLKFLDAPPAPNRKS